MSRTVYLNGAYVPEEEAMVSVFDRGFLFADGIYEVTAVLDGKICEFEGHVKRLERSLGVLDMPMPVDKDELLEIHRELVKRNNLDQGAIYLQVTRGAADRDFVYPKNVKQTLVLFTQAKTLTDDKAGIKVIAAPDIRWGRRDVKTVQLLAPSMCKMMAKAAGKDDAWMVEDGFVTEGSSNNAYIVTKEGKIVTRNLSNSILHGITRSSVLRIAAEMDMEIEERAFTIAEAQDAAEAFITAATTFVCPVLEIDGATIGDGKPGPVATRLNTVYIEEARKGAI
ncbi:D-amino-acid transaminase [Maridesulfovibrio zosterae]|uniref:D-amino-acid transaminase n=1 Tax=Maridesulfovibrio zosterae TaxID=82171 RepID=UPI0004821211|nr:D-amino-acid transaminase [Maridesulfovibrio zosterae]